MPATIPYNHTHDSHTGGSYNSSDRGSSSTSGKRLGPEGKDRFQEGRSEVTKQMFFGFFSQLIFVATV